MTNMVTVGLCLTNVPLAFTPHPWSTGSYQHHVLIINRWYDLLVGTERHGSGELHMSYLVADIDRTSEAHSKRSLRPSSSEFDSVTCTAVAFRALMEVAFEAPASLAGGDKSPYAASD